MPLRDTFLPEFEHEMTTTRKTLDGFPRIKSIGSRMTLRWPWAGWRDTSLKCVAPRPRLFKATPSISLRPEGLPRNQRS